MESFFAGAVSFFVIVCVFVMGIVLSAHEFENRIEKSQVIYIQDQGYKCEKVK